MADAAIVNITFEDEEGNQTSRQYGASAVPADADVQALANALQNLTTLSVVKATMTKEVTGFTSTAAETNADVAGGATISTFKTDGRRHTFNVPQLKTAYRSGDTVNGTHADIAAFLTLFDDGGGAAATAGKFTCSDGETLSELAIEAGKIKGKVSR